MRVGVLLHVIEGTVWSAEGVDWVNGFALIESD